MRCLPRLLSLLLLAPAMAGAAETVALAERIQRLEDVVVQGDMPFSDPLAEPATQETEAK